VLFVVVVMVLFFTILMLISIVMYGALVPISISSGQCIPSLNAMLFKLKVDSKREL